MLEGEVRIYGTPKLHNNFPHQSGEDVLLFKE